MSLRIAFISSTFPDYKKCQYGEYAGKLAQSLGGLTHDVHVITTGLPEIKNTFERVTVHKVMQNWNLLEAPRLLQALAMIRPQIIHINHPTALTDGPTKFLLNFFPEVNRSIIHSKIVTTLHEFTERSWLSRKKILPLALGSDFLTVSSEKNKTALSKALPASMKDKIEIINMADIDHAANQFSRVYSRLV